MDNLLKASLGLWMTLVLVGAFLYAPTAAGLRELSRIIYFHVPAAWVAVLAYGVAMVQGIFYLRHRDCGLMPSPLRRWSSAPCLPY